MIDINKFKNIDSMDLRKIIESVDTIIFDFIDFMQKHTECTDKELVDDFAVFFHNYGLEDINEVSGLMERLKLHFDNGREEFFITEWDDKPVILKNVVSYIIIKNICAINNNVMRLYSKKFYKNEYKIAQFCKKARPYIPTHNKEYYSYISKISNEDIRKAYTDFNYELDEIFKEIKRIRYIGNSMKYLAEKAYCVLGLSLDYETQSYIRKPLEDSIEAFLNKIRYIDFVNENRESLSYTIGKLYYLKDFSVEELLFCPYIPTNMDKKDAMSTFVNGIDKISIDQKNLLDAINKYNSESLLGKIKETLKKIFTRH